MIRIQQLEKVFASNRGPVRAVSGIDLEVAEGEFLVLLGPSGCGKTTTLRCVAGLERPDAGSIEIAGEIVDSAASGIHAPSERCNIGMVFQSYAVWPHLTVFENVALPLIAGCYPVARSQVGERVLEALRLVQLERLEARPSTDLSGGQQQRVALARAIVTRPKVLLMDEPLSNLDARLRDQMRIELKKIVRSLGVTTLHVTHDQAEALSLGDRVCVMQDGKISQIGRPQEVYAYPATRFVAEFVGEMNLIVGTIVGLEEADTTLGRLRCSTPPSCRQGSEVMLGIRPEQLVLCRQPSHDQQFVRGTIVSINYVGDATLFEVEAGGEVLWVKQPGGPGFAAGELAAVVFPSDSWRVYS